MPLQNVRALRERSATHAQTARSQTVFGNLEGGLALALVTSALEQLSLLVLAHLLAPLLDHTAHG